MAAMFISHAQNGRNRKVGRHRAPSGCAEAFRWDQSSIVGGLPTGYARFVGRVGALAVALGVGAAVATGYGTPVAYADDGTGTSDTEQHDAAPEANDGGNTAGGEGGDTEAPVAVVNGEPVGGNENSTDDTTPGGGTATEMNVNATTIVQHDDEENEPATEGPESEVGNGSTTIEGVITPAVAPEPAVVNPEPPVPSSPPVDNTAPASTPEVVNAPADITPPVSAPPDGGPAVNPLIVQHNTGGSQDPLGGATDGDDGAAGARLTTFNATAEDVSSSALVAPQPNIIEPEQPSLLAGLGTVPGVVVRLAATVAAAFLSPFLVTGPSAPAAPNMLWAVLAWVRREFERTLCNDTPAATDDAVSTNEDTSVDIDALLNDADGDEDPLAVTDFTQPEHGTVTYDAATKQFTYTPDADWSGVDSFQYAVGDEGGLPHFHGILNGLFNVGHRDTATVTVTVNAVADTNIPPVAGNDSVTANGSTPVTDSLPGSDPDSPTLTYAIVTNPAHGTITSFNTSTGAYTYTPNPDLDDGETRIDSFTYTVSDGTNTSGPGLVTITATGVNDAPVAVDDDAGTVSEDSTTGLTYNVVANDTDVDIEPLTVDSATNGQYGTVTYSGGSVTYTPSATNPTVLGLASGETLDDTFTYVVTDGDATDQATVTVTIVGVDTPPFANPDDAGSVAEDSTTPLTYDVLANDIDYDSDTVTLTAVSNGSYGTVTYSGGSVTYTLDNTNAAVQALGAGGSMTDTFTYDVIDDEGNTSQGTVTVTITGVNDAPVITVVDSGTPDEETGIIHGSVTATDVDGGPLTYSIPVTNTQYGSVSIDPQTGQFVYTPDEPVPSSLIPGTGFDDGTLTGWNVGTQTGSFDPTVEAPDNLGEGVGVSTGSITFNSPARTEDTPQVPARTWEYTPDGHAGMLSPNSQQTFTEATNALGLTAEQRQEIVAISTSTTGGPTDAAWITKTVYLEADTTYTMSWNYIGTDYQPYNDGSITTLVHEGGGPDPTIEVNGYESNYAILGYTNTGTGDYSTGSYGSTGWQTSTYRVSESGNYTLGFAVFNIGDQQFDPILLIDNKGGTTLRDGLPYDPVPPNSPTAPQTVNDTFTVNVDDGNGGTDTVDVTVQVTIEGTTPPV